MAENGLSVFDECGGGKCFGECVCCHMCCGAGNETDFAKLYFFTQRVNSDVDVFGALTVYGIFRHENACMIVFIHWGGLGLRDTKVR